MQLNFPALKKLCLIYFWTLMYNPDCFVPPRPARKESNVPKAKKLLRYYCPNKYTVKLGVRNLLANRTEIKWEKVKEEPTSSIFLNKM